METTTYDLSNGPGKMDLSIALFRGTEEHDDVGFMTTDKEGKFFAIKCHITGIQVIETGTRESWSITGYAKFPEYLDHGRPGRAFRAHFNTQKRTGRLELIPG